MYVNFDINSLVLVLRDSPELTNLLIGGLTAEKPYYESVVPYAYLESVALPARGIFTRHIVTFNVVLGNDGIDKEFKTIISAMDNAVLQPIDGCLPIKKVGDVTIVDVTKGQASQKTRHTDKGNLFLKQDYYFDASIVD